MSGLSSVSLLRGVWGQVGKLSSVCHGHERPPNGKRKLPRAGKNGELNKSNGVSERGCRFFVFPWELPASLRFAEGVYVHIRCARMVVCPDPFTHCSTHPSQQQTSHKQRQKQLCHATRPAAALSWDRTPVNAKKRAQAHSDQSDHRCE